MDAARGQGMEPGADRQAKVELPLGLPTIVGGIRTLAVNVIATATIASLAGASRWATRS